MKCHRCEIEKTGNRVFCSACGTMINYPNFKVTVMESTSSVDGSRFETKMSQSYVNSVRARKVVKTEAQKENANLAFKEEKKAQAERERIKIYVP